MKKRIHAFIVSLSFLLAPLNDALINCAAQQPTNALTPEQELATFHLADPNLTIKLIAAEPDIVAPVALAWNEDGKLFVVEMTDYPSGPVSGRVKLLEDPDGDGRYEKVTVFADKLPFPNGVMPWRGGVLVTAAPDIWFLKDTNGNGVADVRRKVLTGFGEGNQQLRVNGLFWGVDNWTYGANGRSDGEVKWADDGKTAGSIRRRDFRFRPDTREFEAIAGNSQFGMAHDDWGNRFPVFNNVPVRQVILEDRYVNRVPTLNWPDTVPNIAAPGDNGRLYPLSQSELYVPQPSGYSTSACGPSISRADGLGETYRDSAFSCEPVQNLVTRRRLDANGMVFVSRRFPGETDREFLSSTDTWFHPVFTASGPDGALYVVDFYRKIVEHPQWVAENLKDKIAWREGENHGRIWRICARNFKPRRARPRLSRAKTVELVKHLEDNIGWWRDTAQRLIFERQDRLAIPALSKLARQSASPQGRLNALYSLNGLGALTPEAVARAMNDAHPAVQENSLRLSEPFLKNDPPREMIRRMLTLTEHPSPRVRFQLALSLGEMPGPEKLATLTRLAEKGLTDRWQAFAILSGAADCPWPFLKMLADQHPRWVTAPDEPQAAFTDEILALVGATADDRLLTECMRWLASAENGWSPSMRLPLLAPVAEGFSKSGRSLPHWLGELAPERKDLADMIQHFLVQAPELAMSAGAPLRERLAAMRLFALFEPTSAGPALLKCLVAAQPAEIQSAAVALLPHLDTAAPAAAVFAGWSSYTKATRQELMRAAARSATFGLACLDAIEQQTISPLECDAATRDAFRRSQNAQIKHRVERLMPKISAADRDLVVASFKPCLQLTGNSKRGGETFAKICAACHAVEGTGGKVGPDLSGIATHAKETLLVEILDPTRQVLPDYLSYTCLTSDGEVVTGRIITETSSSVTLRRPNEPDATIPRSRIKELKADGKSLMPDGLEEGLNHQDMADLLEFLRKPGFP